MKRNIFEKVIAIMLFCLVLNICGEPVAYCAAGEKVTVGIAWRADTDSDFYTNIVAALQEAGATPVLLGQVVDKDFLYSNGQLSRQGITANDYLAPAYAEKVKAPDKRRSNAAEVLQGIDAIGMVRLSKKDVVRHELVQQIVQAYDAHYREQQKGSQA